MTPNKQARPVAVQTESRLHTLTPPAPGTLWSLNERPVVQVRVTGATGPVLGRRVAWESAFGKGETDLRAFRRKFQQI
ncbi:hypothetical protein ACXR2T_10115 [Leucobacter sp. HY1910]